MVGALLLPWDGRVEGLASGTDAPLWGGRLGGATEAALRAAGATPGLDEADEWLVVEDGLALGPGAVGAALAAGRARGAPCRLTLGGELGALLHGLPGAGPTLAWLPGGARPEGLSAALPVVEIPPDERTLPLQLPGGAEGLPISDRLVLPVRHWLDLLWANLLGLPACLWGELVGRSAPLAVWRLARAALRVGSLAPERLASGLVRRGEGVRVHRSAVVEASVLGAGCEVGPGAVVRGCVLGDGARVEAQALCEGVVLAPRAVVQRQAMLRFCVLGEGAMVGGVTQLSVIGAGASLKRGAYGMDQSLDGVVRVLRDGALVEAPLGLAGVCLGEGAVLGCGVRVAPGRMVPPGLKVVAGGALLGVRAEDLDARLLILGG